MAHPRSALVAPLVGGTAYRRWAYLIVGGALMVPYLLIGVFVVPAILPDAGTGQLGVGLALVAVAAIMIVLAVTACIPAVRMLEGTIARELLRGPLAGLELSTERSWPARWRTVSWFLVHIVVGGVISVLTLVVPPTAVSAFALPFTGRVALIGIRVTGARGLAGLWLPACGVLALLLLFYLVAGVGAGLARLAPRFLGLSASEQLAALQQQTARQSAQQTERNRLARELHDSVGHALNVVSVQAGAAGHVLDTDPEFARRALAAIEDAARSALDDLDHVLGLLREDQSPGAGTASAASAGQPTLAELPELVDRTRLAGVAVDYQVDGDLERIPPAVSRETYRIVQEGLTNVLRHAGRVPARLRLAVRPDALEVCLSNPLVGRPKASRQGRGGRGLPGMRERASVLRGELTAGVDDDADGGQWRVAVLLPLTGAGPADAGPDKD